jgi:hypothetical protein
MNWLAGRAIVCAVLCVITILLIVIYGMFLRRTGRADALEKAVIPQSKMMEFEVTGWSMTHLFFFGILGMLCPDQHFAFLLIGVGWEAVETAMGQNDLRVSGRRLQLIGDTDGDGCSKGDTGYWYGRASDVCMDLVGYVIGSAIATRLWPRGAKK